MADHQQQLVTTTGETAAMGTAGTVPGEEDTINISLDMECNPEIRQWHDSDEEDDKEEPTVSMDLNVVLSPCHEGYFPLVKQLDCSLTPPPVLFHVDDTEMASFAMPHVAEQPASASSASSSCSHSWTLHLWCQVCSNDQNSSEASRMG